MEIKIVSSNAYISRRIENFQLAKKLYLETHYVEYSTTDHWVKVGNKVINGICKKEMEKIIESIGGNNE